MIVKKMYFDMDSVLADFVGCVKNYVGWKLRIKKIRIDLNLETMKCGIELRIQSISMTS